MPPAVVKLKALFLNPRLRALLSSRRLKIALIALAVYVLDAWLLGSFTVFFKNAEVAGRMFANPFYAAVVLPFQGVLQWWLLLNAVAGVSGFVVFLKLSASFPGMFKVKKKEPEFTEDPSCGTSRWLTKNEARRVLSFGHGPGIIFGKMEGEPVRLDSPRLNKNVIVWGPPGRMKTRALVVPNLLQAALSDESCVVTDPKKDILPVARPFFESQGYTVKVFDLIDMLRSDRWN
ncbi:MAG: type IV secretory system conjugative DNA transfer family protein, partial [Bacillota bacterium]